MHHGMNDYVSHSDRNDQMNQVIGLDELPAAPLAYICAYTQHYLSQPYHPHSDGHSTLG
jgi:hypothetical protein